MDNLSSPWMAYSPDNMGDLNESTPYLDTLQRGWYNLLGSYYGMNSLIGDEISEYTPIDLKNFAEIARAEAYKKEQQAAALKDAIDWDKEIDAGNYGKAVLAGAVENAPQLALSMIPTLGATRALGLGASAAGKLGAALGGTSAGVQMTGSLYNEGTPAGLAVGSGILSGLGASVGEGLLARGLSGFVKSAASSAAKAGATKPVIKSAMKEAAKTYAGVVASEIPSETLDGFLEAGAKNIRDGKSWGDFSTKQVKDALKGGVFGGAVAGVYGAPASVGSYLNTRRDNSNIRQQQAWEKSLQELGALEEGAGAPNVDETLETTSSDILNDGQLLDTSPTPTQVDAEGNTDEASTRRNAIQEDVRRLQGIEQVRQSREKTAATQDKRQADAVQRFIDWQQQVRSANQKNKQEQTKTASTMQDARTKAAEGMEKFRQTRLKTMSDGVKLAQNIQKMQQAAQEANQPKLTAAEQKEQQQQQAAQAIAPQLLQRTNDILNPQAAQERQQQQQKLQQVQQLLAETRQAQEQAVRNEQIQQLQSIEDRRRDMLELYGRREVDFNGNPTIPSIRSKSKSTWETSRSHPFRNAHSIFGGVRAITEGNLPSSDPAHAQLVRAKVMENQGVRPADIWRETGWFRGAENAWKFEIYDDISKINFDNSMLQTEPDGSTYFTVGDLYNNPKLYEAYPSLRDVKAYMMRTGPDGTLGIVLGPDKIGINDLVHYHPNDAARMKRSMARTLLHELQHLVQEKEGFAAGSDLFVDGQDHYNRSAGEWEANQVIDRAERGRGRDRKYLSHFPMQRVPNDLIIRTITPTGAVQESRPTVSQKKANKAIATQMRKVARSLDWTGKKMLTQFADTVDGFYDGFTVDMSDSLRARIIPDNARSRAQIAQDEADRSILDFNKAWEDVQSALPGLKEKFLTNFVDALRPIYKMVESIRKEGRISFFGEVATQMEALPNITGQKLKQFHTNYVVPLENAIAAYAKTTNATNNEVAYAQAVDYWEAMAILERKRVIAEANPKAPEYMPERSYKSLSDTIAKYKAIDMMPIGKAIQAINNAKLDLLVENKIISEESAANFRAKYKSYMPLFADWESMIKVVEPNWARSNIRRSISAGKALEKFSQTVKNNPGDWVTKDPVISAIKQLYDAVVLSEKVQVQRGILELAKDNSSSTMLQLVREQDTSKLMEFDESTGQLRSRKLLQDIPTQEGGRRVVSENTVVCIDEDGVAKRVEFADPRVAAAFKGENTAILGTFLQTARSVGRFLMQLMTGKSPLFWMVNPIRDAQTAALNIASLKRSLSDIIDLERTPIVTQLLVRGIDDAFSLLPGTGTRGIRSALFDYYQNGDATFANNKKMDLATRQRMKYLPQFFEYGSATSYFSDSWEKAIKKGIISGMNSKNPTTVANSAANILKGIDGWMDAVSDSLENKTRYIIFYEVVEALKKGTLQPDGTYKAKNGNVMTDEEIFARAANAAMNITVNFSKKGAYAPVLDTLYWFAGANIAGNARMLETVVRKGADGKVDWGNIAAFAAVPVLARVGLAAICRDIMGDDEEDGVNYYDKIASYEKDGNIILPDPRGGKNYVKIPLAYGFNIFWGLGAIGDAIYAKVKGRPGPTIGDTILGIFGNAFDNFSIAGRSEEGLGMLVPSTIRPVFQWYTNKDFAGRPISREGTSAFGGKNIPDSERYWSTMSKPVIELCQWMNQATGGSSVRPGAVDISPETLEHFATAYTGGIGRLAMTSTARMVEWARTGKIPDVRKIAGVGTFFGSVRPSNDNVIFSNYRDVITAAVNETKLAQTDMSLSPKRREELIARNANVYKLKDKMNLVQKQLNDTSKQQKDLRKKGASDASIDALEEKKQLLRKDLIKAAVKAKIPSKL